MPHDSHSLLDRGRTIDARQPATRRPPPLPQRDPCAEDCKPVCPACGGLDCLCRPRFFPGQLLTDDDLNRLSRYIVDKNKLHNRYLHGWGVACGLEVTCDACDPQQVVVRTGYALSPCGDDIIVCRDQAVNICELIDACRPIRDPVCDPPYDRPPRDCRGGRQRWVLAVCYDETPSRGLTALLGAADTPCKQPCSCGGSSSCTRCGGSGCGCAGGPGACGCGTAADPRPRKTAKKHCEPTLICEGYKFVVYPAPEIKLPPPPRTPPDRPPPTPGTPPPVPIVNQPQYEALIAWMFANRKAFGPLLERVLCCIQRAVEIRPDLDRGQLTGAAALDAYQSYLEALRDFALEFAIHRCAFVGRIETLYQEASVWIRDRRGDSALSAAALAERYRQLDIAWLDLLTECFCSALLPPCPEPATSNCVPLAVVTLHPNDCRVAEICNWEARKLLITWRTVGYWLSWLPWRCLQETIAKICCGPNRENTALVWLMVMLGAAFSGIYCGRPPSQVPQAPPPAPPQPGAVPAGTAAPATPAAGAEAATFAGFSAAGGAGASSAGPTAPASGAGAMFVAAFGPAMDADKLLPHLLGEFDRLRAGQAAAPLWASVAAHLSDGSALAALGSSASSDAVALNALRAQVAELQKTVAAQQQVLDKISHS
jgi:hypothetical protein